MLCADFRISSHKKSRFLSQWEMKTGDNPSALIWIQLWFVIHRQKSLCHIEA